MGLRILKILGDVGLPAHRIELEVTESAIINDVVTARIVLDDLVNAGVSIALDDFGTGYSSLAQLSNYRFDKIKIDRSFVASFETNDKQDKVVKAIIALGAGLGVAVTAEGIEAESQLQRLQDLGCDIGQGYLLGRPVPAAETIGGNASIKASQDHANLFGRPNAGEAMIFDFPTLIMHAAKTRPLISGTIIGSGTISNQDSGGAPGKPVDLGGVGYSCISEQRVVETILQGSPKSRFMRHGDVVRIEMRESGESTIFGAIEQRLVINTRIQAK